jgi:hypothetical protein
VCDRIANLGRRKCGLTAAALANALLQLTQSVDGSFHCIEVRCVFPDDARDGPIVSCDHGFIATLNAME